MQPFCCLVSNVFDRHNVAPLVLASCMIWKVSTAPQGAIYCNCKIIAKYICHFEHMVQITDTCLQIFNGAFTQIISTCCFLVSLHLCAVQSVYGMVGHDDNTLLLVFTAKSINPIL